MACVSEAIGLALMNSSGAPAPYESRDQYGDASGVAVMNLIEKNIRARDIVTRKSLENAARVVLARGALQMLACICMPSRMRQELILICSTCVKFSATLHTLCLCAQAVPMLPRIFTKWVECLL